MGSEVALIQHLNWASKIVSSQNLNHGGCSDQVRPAALHESTFKSHCRLGTLFGCHQKIGALLIGPLRSFCGQTQLY